jgi:hypothetical protein
LFCSGLLTLALKACSTLDKIVAAHDLSIFVRLF